MDHGGHTVEVTNLSPNATERDAYDFFSFSGEVEHVEIIRAMLVDQPVCIDRWGHYEDPYDIWSRPSWRVEEDVEHTGVQVNNFSMTPREAMTMTQEVVKTTLSKGYILSKDALSKAKAFNESHQVSATAAAKIAELSKRIGLTDKTNAGVGTIQSVDEQYHVSQTTKTVASATSRTAAAIANSIVLPEPSGCPVL